MIAVIFEVWPKPEHRQEYLDLAAELKPILETIDGFISVERFESLTEKGKILSLSVFRDEDALAAFSGASEVARIPDAGHDFRGQEQVAAGLIDGWLRRQLS